MQTIGNFWWVWLAGLLLCWGFVGLNQFRQNQISSRHDVYSSLVKSNAAGKNVLVGFRYLGFVFLVLLIFALAVKLINWAVFI